MYALTDELKPAPGDFVSVPNVRAISNGLSLIGRLADGRHFAVPSHCIGDGSEVRRPGDRGALVVLRWFAEEHRLLP